MRDHILHALMIHWRRRRSDSAAGVLEECSIQGLCAAKERESGGSVKADGKQRQGRSHSRESSGKSGPPQSGGQDGLVSVTILGMPCVMILPICM